MQNKEAKIKAIQDWYQKKNGFELSRQNAIEVLSAAEFWGAQLLCAAYDIVYYGSTQEGGVSAGI